MTPLHDDELVRDLNSRHRITLPATVDIVLRSTNRKVYSGRIVAYDHDRFYTEDSVFSRKQYAAFASMPYGL